jgi:hypothetical protein
LHFINEGIGCIKDHATEVAHARFQEKKLHEHKTRGGRPVLSQIVEADEGDEDEDDTAILSKLIALAEVGLQVEEDEDDTARLSELITLVEAGLQAEEGAFLSQAEEDEDDTARLTINKLTLLTNYRIHYLVKQILNPNPS